MHKLYKSITLLLLGALFTTYSTAQVVVSEGFETANPFLPIGWQVSPQLQGPQSYWGGATASATVTPHSGTRMARFRASGNPTGIKQSLITAPIDYTNIGGNMAYFSLWMFRDSLSQNFDSLVIYINTDTNITTATHLGTIARCNSISIPDTVAGNTWNYYSYSIPASFNGDTNYVILRGYGDAGRSIYIDDIEYDTYPAICNGQPSIGTLNASTYSICGGSGSSQLSLQGTSNTSEQGVNIQWQMSSSPNGPWVDTLTNSIHMSTGIITVGTYYRAYISCSTSGLADTSVVAYVDVNSNPLPTLTTIPTGTGPQGNQFSYCIGTAGISIKVTGASTYTWSPATGINQTVGDSVLANPANQTNYTITGIDTLGCIATKNITVIPRIPPVFSISSSADTICKGDTVMLTAFATGFSNYNYMWLPTGISNDTLVVSPDSTTSYFVTATSVNSGCSKTDTLNIEVTPPAIVSFTFTIADSIVSFSSTLQNATIISWDFGDGNSSTIDNPTHTYQNGGLYHVKLIANTPCGIDTIISDINITLQGIKEISKSKTLVVYPNPTDDFIFVQISNLTKSSSIEIFDLNKRLVSSSLVSNNNYTSGKLQVNVDELKSGFYFLKLANSQENFIGYFIKK